MKPPMLHTAYKAVYTRNAYGDFTVTGETALKCHVRYINEQVTASNNETVQSDIMFWFEPDANVNRQDIIKFDGEHYRVERVIKARRLRSPEVQFIKVECLKYGVIS